ncbi:hypothetical protein HAX54_037351 [Datura stramonium]|uniref:Uncharacterized protein n=1 Tax=Datura stramonium TaxID=4076 RepID=A0ABS8RML1_DATST|nr:hypothetical protein [Datura stramonium]
MPVESSPLGYFGRDSTRAVSGLLSSSTYGCPDARRSLELIVSHCRLRALTEACKARSSIGDILNRHLGAINVRKEKLVATRMVFREVDEYE